MSVRLVERVPLVNREGMEIQVKEAIARKPGSSLKIKDVIDDSVITELDKEGFRQALQITISDKSKL